jgi:hypothetical protein
VEEIQLPNIWLEEVPKLRDMFMSIPTTELWNDDTLKSTIQQIKFYWEAGFFAEKETVLSVLEDLDGILAMASKQAENGKKYNPLKNLSNDTEYALYGSELMIGNNTVFLTSDTHQASYIGHNSFNFIRSNNRYFNEITEHWLNNMISKSTPLSLVAKGFITALTNSVSKSSKTNPPRFHLPHARPGPSNTQQTLGIRCVSTRPIGDCRKSHAGE